MSTDPPIARNILMVEDDEADAVLVERALASCVGEYQSQTCGTLESAIEWIEGNDCDLILLDQSLPDCRGLDGIRKIHDQFPEIPIVMLTGLDDDAIALQSLELGAQDYLVKGMANPREFERTLRHAIQRQQVQNENRRLLAQLKVAARSDSLTGVLNRHAMAEDFQRFWERASHDGTPLSCVILDVDYFKRINDQFGHLGGDEVLRIVAQLLKHQTRPGDSIARYGGEEFCVMLIGAGEEEAVAWAERTRCALSAKPIEIGDQGRTVTASFGVAERNADTKSFSDLIEIADQALMVGKNLGRDQVFAFSSMAELQPSDLPQAVSSSR